MKLDMQISAAGLGNAIAYLVIVWLVAIVARTGWECGGLIWSVL